MARRPSISHSPSGDNEETLRKEVASLLSAEVGLGAHVAQDAAFDDFAPENAAKKLGDVDNTPKRVKKSTNKFKPADHEAVPRHDAETRKQEPDASITERGWNEGAGQRPGGKGKVLVDQEDSTVWYEAASVLPKLTDSSAAAKEEVVQVKTSVAQKLIEAEAERYQKKLSRTNASDAQWLQTVRKSGTTRDQIAANALLVEQSAVHNIRALDELISLASKRGGAQAAAGHAVDALKQLFIETLLPDRRLVGFDARPLQCVKPSKAGDKQLLYWWVEDCIKRRYSTFVQALEDLSLGNLDWAKQKALKAAHELLAAKPEQEARLLTIMVNKLGDPSRRMASNAGYLISCLLTEHPLMSGVVVREIERFLFRPNQKARAVYYAVITLNQMVLSHHTKHGSPVAKRLIDIYFTLFNLVLDHKMGNAAQHIQQKADGSTDTKTASAEDVAAGFAAHDVQAEDSDLDQEFDEGDMEDAAAHGKKKISASASRKASFLAQRKGKRAAKGRGGRGGGGKGKGKHGKGGGKGAAAAAASAGTDKGVSAEVADARMLSALIAGVRRAYPYVDSTELEDVFAKHANHLFRTVHVAPLTVSVQALMLLFQVMTSQSAVNDRFHNALYAVLLRPGLSTSSTLPMLFGLLFQALSADVSTRRIAAFIKRMLQFASSAPANVTCGVLVVVSEVLKKKPALWGSILQPEDEGVEVFHDAEDTATDADGHPVEGYTDPKEASKGGTATAAHHRTTPGAGKPIGQQWPPHDYYDITKRTPQFARAERACWWELCGLRAHVHPSVAAMAGALLAGTSVVYDGDPLADLTVLAFLDKFVKRKPKRGDKGKSAMQPVTAEAAEQSMGLGDAPNVSGLPEDARPGSSAFAALAAQDVKAEDVFFHKYFTLEKVRKRRAQVARTKALMKKKKKSGEEGSDEDMWEGDGDDGDDAGSQEDGSAAEDDFLEGLETMQDDAFGDPDAGGLSAQLLAEMAAAADSGDDGGPEGLEEPKGAEDEGNSDSEGSDGDDDVDFDHGELDEDAMAGSEDEDALFGAGSDPESDEMLADDEPSAQGSSGKAMKTSGKPQKKRKESGDMLASYEQYAHLLDKYDEVNKQELPAEELKGGRARKQKRKMKHSDGSKRRKS